MLTREEARNGVRTLATHLLFRHPVDDPRTRVKQLPELLLERILPPAGVNRLNSASRVSKTAL